MKNPKISAVIPVFNGGETLEKCLSSILSQTYRNYEVIAVDNNSTDKTKEIIERFSRQNKKVRYIFEPFRSRGAARNAGIRAAHGKIIAMTDSDCIIPKNWLFELTKPIREEYAKITMGYEKDVIQSYSTRQIQRANKEFLRQFVLGEYIRHLDTKNFAILTSLAKKIMFDSMIFNLEDVDFYLRSRKHAHIKFIPDVRVGHHHKSTVLKAARLNFNRGYWIYKIFRKHYSLDESIGKEIIFSGISFKSYLFYPKWIVSELFRKPISESYFNIIFDCGWRLGVLKGYLERNFLL